MPSSSGNTCRILVHVLPASIRNTYFALDNTEFQEKPHPVHVFYFTKNIYIKAVAK